MNRIDDLLAEGRDDRRRRREAAAVDREAAQRVVADPDDVLGGAVELVVALRRVLRLDDERARAARGPTWSVALWCEWYMCEPVVRAVNSYVNESPGWIGSWVISGTPSMLFGSRWPWKWMPVDSCRLFLKIARILSPSTTSSRGPGHIALNPSAATGSFTASILCWISSTVNSKTLTSPSSVGCLRLVAGALDLVVLAVEEPRDDREGARRRGPRERASPTAPASGRATRSADGAADAAADGAAADAPGEPPGGGGGRRTVRPRRDAGGRRAGGDARGDEAAAGDRGGPEESASRERSGQVRRRRPGCWVERPTDR